MNPDDIHGILDYYHYHFAQTSPAILFLGQNHGFSGAWFWRIEDGPQQFCLRRWPPQYRNSEKLTWTHQVLTEAHRQGCDFVPVPLPTTTGTSLLSCGGFLWQLEPWMTGIANYWEQPNDQRLVNALGALAQFHRATKYATADCPSRMLQERMEMLRRLWSGGKPTEHFLRLEAKSGEHETPEINQIARQVCGNFRILAPLVGGRLNTAKSIDCTKQPILADIWHDHLLFTGNQVTGMVDFGAMRVDSPAADMARLLGSLIGDNRKKWALAVDAYRQEYAISEIDLNLVRIFDQSTSLLAGINWLQWLLVEKRDFGDLQPICRRLRAICQRMEYLVNQH